MLNNIAKFKSNVLTKRKEYLYILANLLIVMYAICFSWKHYCGERIIWILILIWIATGDYKIKFKKMIDSKIVISFILLLAMFILGLLWSEELLNGYNFVRKRPIQLIIAPLMISFYRKSFVKYYLYGMLLSLLVVAIMIFLAKLQILNINLTGNSVPFINRNYLGTMFVFTYGILLYYFRFDKKLIIKNVILALFVLFMAYTIIDLGNRSSYPLMFVTTFIIFIYRFKPSTKQIVIFFLLSSITIYTIYNINNNFNSRMNNLFNNIKNLNFQKQIYEKQTNLRSSLSCRIEFWYYALKLGNKNPIIGTGTGDTILELENLIGKKEADKLFAMCLGNGSKQFNPHNLYLFLYMSFGILGLSLIFWMFLVHFKYGIKTRYVPFFFLVVINFIYFFTNSAMFISKYYTPFYVFAIMTLYLVSKENQSIFGEKPRCF